MCRDGCVLDQPSRSAQSVTRRDGAVREVARLQRAETPWIPAPCSRTINRVTDRFGCSAACWGCGGCREQPAHLVRGSLPGQCPRNEDARSTSARPTICREDCPCNEDASDHPEQNRSDFAHKDCYAQLRSVRIRPTMGSRLPSTALRVPTVGGHHDVHDRRARFRCRRTFTISTPMGDPYVLDASTITSCHHKHTHGRSPD